MRRQQLIDFFIPIESRQNFQKTSVCAHLCLEEESRMINYLLGNICIINRKLRTFVKYVLINEEK